MIPEELFSELSLWTGNFNLKSFNFHVYIRIHIENTNTDPQSSWVLNSEYGTNTDPDPQHYKKQEKSTGTL